MTTNLFIGYTNNKHLIHTKDIVVLTDNEKCEDKCVNVLNIKLCELPEFIDNSRSTYLIISENCDNQLSSFLKELSVIYGVDIQIKN